MFAEKKSCMSSNYVKIALALILTAGIATGGYFIWQARKSSPTEIQSTAHLANDNAVGNVTNVSNITNVNLEQEVTNPQPNVTNVNLEQEATNPQPNVTNVNLEQEVTIVSIPAADDSFVNQTLAVSPSDPQEQDVGVSAQNQPLTPSNLEQ